MRIKRYRAPADGGLAFWLTAHNFPFFATGLNLLKPASISESGYKIYSASQIIDFLAISSLKEAGCSLDEIRAFQEQHNPETTLELFNKKKSEIEEEAS